ncbi:hypothetical protein CDD83_796 [Cordyceps sp. RAO-2017]|nr:hypothetical protein CDD83_796 [Cordyceps sp. RAO-2017]
MPLSSIPATRPAAARTAGSPPFHPPRKEDVCMYVVCMHVPPVQGQGTEEKRTNGKQVGLASIAPRGREHESARIGKREKKDEEEGEAERSREPRSAAKVSPSDPPPSSRSRQWEPGSAAVRPQRAWPQPHLGELATPWTAPAHACPPAPCAPARRMWWSDGAAGRPDERTTTTKQQQQVVNENSLFLLCVRVCVLLLLRQRHRTRTRTTSVITTTTTARVRVPPSPDGETKRGCGGLGSGLEASSIGGSRATREGQCLPRKRGERERVRREEVRRAGKAFCPLFTRGCRRTRLLMTSGRNLSTPPSLPEPAGRTLAHQRALPPGIPGPYHTTLAVQPSTAGPRMYNARPRLAGMGRSLT